MKAIFFASVLGLALSASFSTASEVVITSCMDDNGATAKLDITPLPIKVAPGTKITLKAAFDLLKEIPEDAQLKLRFKKDLLIDIPIPCLNVPTLGTHLGSCDYAMKDVMNGLGKYICTLFPEGQECSLPLKPNKFGGSKDGISMTVPDNLPSAIFTYARGRFIAQVIVSDANGNDLICLKTNLSFA